MMNVKRVGYIYENICDIDNIKNAILKASLGKRHKKYVMKILNNIDYYAREIQTLLKNKEYIPSPYKIKTILDGSSGKERTIYKPQFYPDQIMHWALMLQIEPIMMRGMYEYNCGSIPERGIDLGKRSIEKWLHNDYKGTKYCLKLDIRKYFPSINKELLKSSFRDKIKDNDCLWLIDIIIDSSDSGLPIGNYTSQWFANFFLEELDHYIKEEIQIKYYIRYIDDIVLLDSNKKKLHKAKDLIEKYLISKDLKLKNNWQLFKVKDRPIDFLGFKFYYDRTTLRKKTALRIKRRMSKISKKTFLSYEDACAIISYWGWIKHSDSYNFYDKNIKSKVSIKEARRVVSEYAKSYGKIEEIWAIA